MVVRAILSSCLSSSNSSEPLRSVHNRVYRLPGFVYGKIRLLEEQGEGARLEVEMRPRANGRTLCSGCGQPAPGYDRLRPRRFQFVPMLGRRLLPQAPGNLGDGAFKDSKRSA